MMKNNSWFYKIRNKVTRIKMKKKSNNILKKINNKILNFLFYLK